MAAGIPHSRIVLGGFSQGGSMSYFTGFQMKVALAGVLILSGRIPRLQVRACVKRRLPPLAAVLPLCS